MAGAYAYLLGMFETRLPVGVGMEEMEFVGSFKVLMLVVVVELIVGQQHRGFYD